MLGPKQKNPAARPAPVAPAPPAPAKHRHEEPITLAQFLKVVQVAQTGGHAKALVREGRAWVNGEADNRPGRKLEKGDIVVIDGKTFTVDR